MFKNVTTNQSNVGIGSAAGQQLIADGSDATRGVSNVFIGHTAGQFVQKSSYSVFIGTNAGTSTSSSSNHLDGDKNTCIGYNSGNDLITTACENTF